MFEYFLLCDVWVNIFDAAGWIARVTRGVGVFLGVVVEVDGW